MAILRRVHGAATAWTTSQALPYSTSATAGDRCWIVALNTVMPGTAPAGWTSVASGTANGYSLNIYEKNTVYAGGDATPTITAAAGTGGVAWIEHFASDVGGMTISRVDAQVALDSAATSTAFTATGSSATSANNDWLVGFMGLKSSATMSANPTAQVLTQASATLGTTVGQFGARLVGASPTNSLYYATYTRPVTTGAAGAMTFSATAGTGGANAAGPAGLMIVREVTDATPAPAAVVSVTAVDVVTVLADANQTTTPPVVVSLAAVPLVAFPTPPTVNNAEGGSNGTTVSIGNSGGASGTAFSDVNAGVTYSNAQVAHGALAYAFAGTAATFNAVTLNSPGTGSVAGCAVRFGAYLTGYPSATTTFLAIQTAAGASIAGLNLLTTGVLQVVETGGAFVGNFTTPIPLNTQIRIEVWIDGINATTSVIHVEFYPDDSLTPTETHTYTGRNTGTAAMGKALYGKLTQAPGMTTYYLDDLAQDNNNAQAIGPVTAVDVTPAPAVVVATAAVPSPVVTTVTDATPVTTAVAAVAAVDAPVVVADSNATPAPAAVVAVTAVDAPTVIAGNDATTTPAAVVAVTDVPAVSLPLDGSPQPATVTAIAGIWLMQGGAIALTTDPTEAAAVAAIPSPVVTGDSNVTPSPAAVVATAAVPAPVVIGEQFATLTPAVVVATTTIDVPVVTGDSNATPTPARVVTVTAIPAVVPDVTSTAAVDVLSVDAVAAVDPPAVQSGSSGTATPSEAAAASAVPAPVVLADSNATPQPSEVLAVTTVDVPTVFTDSSATAIPGVVVGVADVPAPSVQTGSDATVAPTAVDTFAAVAAPVVIASSDATVTTVVVLGAASVGTVTIQTDSNLTLAVGEVIASTAVGAPVVLVDSNATPVPAAVVAIAAVAAVTVQSFTDTTVVTSTVVATTGVNPPLLATEFNAPVDVAVIAAFAAVPDPFIHGLVGAMGKPVNGPHVHVRRTGGGVVVHDNGSGVLVPSYA